MLYGESTEPIFEHRDLFFIVPTTIGDPIELCYQMDNNGNHRIVSDKINNLHDGHSLFLLEVINFATILCFIDSTFLSGVKARS